MPRLRRAVAAVGCALVALGSVTGCGAAGVGTTSAASPSAAPPSAASAAPEPATPAPPSPEATAPRTPGAADVRARGTAVTADGVTVLHLLAADAGTTVDAQPEAEQTVLTLDPGEPDRPVDVLVAVPDGATVQPQEDGSLLVLTGDGRFIGGTAPVVGAAGGTEPRIDQLADGVLRLTATGSVSTRVGSAALAGTDWGDREGGRSLAVEPTPWARTAGLAGEAAVWAELVEAVPEADTQVMHDQLVCHAVGAPDKATWNLEPWRPDIGLLKIMLARCNPT